MRISEFKDPFTGRKGIYLFTTTDHLERSLLFRDDADFVQGSNTIALATLKYPVKVLCYALMDNHIHLLLTGKYTDCLAFFAWVLHRIARMLELKYGVSGILKLQASDVQAVVDRNMLLNEVCYLLRNSYKARIGSPYSMLLQPLSSLTARLSIAGIEGGEADVRDACQDTGGMGTCRWTHLEQVFCGLPDSGAEDRKQP